MVDLENLLQTCKNSGLRKTKALKAILDFMLKSDLPVSLTDLETAPELDGLCDRTTIFRTLQRLEAAGLLRRISFSDEKSAKFSLRKDHEHQEFLICQSCSDIQVLDIGCPVGNIQKELEEKSGFKKMSHDLTFYGVCKNCQD